jgi:hypothetical protein
MYHVSRSLANHLFVPGKYFLQFLVGEKTIMRSVADDFL